VLNWASASAGSCLTYPLMVAIQEISGRIGRVMVMASLATSAEISGAGRPIVKDLGISSNWFFTVFSASPVKFGGDWSPVGCLLDLNTGHR
jgi:hypothetical protein